MPSPSPSWNLIRAYGTWHNQDGTKKAGSYRVFIPQRVTNATDDVIVPKGMFAQGSLAQTSGQPSFDVLIPAVDDPDIAPHDWTIEIEIRFADGSPTEVYNVAPSLSGGPINLRTVVIPSNAATPSDLMYRGVPGGLAVYDADGDVVNAAGVKITGGGGGGGGGNITSNQIDDATSLGRSVLTASSAANARAAIGAGTSNLTLGTTGTTAKAGDYAPTVAGIAGTTGTRSASTALHGDGSWKAPAGGADASSTTKGIVRLGGDLAGTADNPTVPGLETKQDADAQHTLDQLAPGASIVIDYYKNVYGAAGAWPATRPTPRTDIDVTWRGPTDPGNIMLPGDIFDLVGA